MESGVDLRSIITPAGSRRARGSRCRPSRSCWPPSTRRTTRSCACPGSRAHPDGQLRLAARHRQRDAGLRADPRQAGAGGIGSDVYESAPRPRQPDRPARPGRRQAAVVDVAHRRGARRRRDALGAPAVFGHASTGPGLRSRRRRRQGRRRGARHGAGPARSAPACVWAASWSTWRTPTRSRAVAGAPAGWPTTTPRRSRADYCINEGGGAPIHSPQRAALPGVHRARRAASKRRSPRWDGPGHASRPWATDNPVPTLAEVIDKIAAYEPEIDVSHPFFREVLEALGVEQAPNGREHRPDRRRA